MLSGLSVVEVGDRPSVRHAGKLLFDMGASVKRFALISSTPDEFFDSGKQVTNADSLPELGETVRSSLAESDFLLVGLSRPDRTAARLQTSDLPSSGLKVVLLSPFGETGAYADYKATDRETQAAGGVSLSVGSPGRAPLPYPGNQTATQAGTVAVIALLAASRAASETTEIIEISESDVWATLHAGTGVISWIFHNRKRQRAGHRVADGLYPHQLFRCKDGWIAVDCAEGRQWRSFLQITGHPEWIDDPAFRNRRDLVPADVDKLLAPWLEDRTRDEVFRECVAARIPAAPVLTIEEVRNLEHLRLRGFVRDEGGRLVLGLPFQSAAPSTEMVAPLAGGGR